MNAQTLRAGELALVNKYVAQYPHLKTLAINAVDSPQAARTLGDQISRLACPDSITGPEAISAGRIGLVV